MLTCADITQGTYLRLTTARRGDPAGLIGIVHTIGTDWAGHWFFQLRYLNRPPGQRNKTVSPWSLNLHDHDLEHFEQIDTWEEVQNLLQESQRPSEHGGLPRRSRQKGIRRPRYLRGTRHPNQLKLYEWD
jgi:hypothetical protein